MAIAKIKLGSRPKSFKHTVTFPMLDGTTGTIECLFKYRTRDEFGKFVDGLFDAAGTKPPADGQFSMKELMSRTSTANADYLLAVLDGWNLDDELTHGALVQLADELPGAAATIMEAYRAAVVEGRLGN